jgi:glutamate racemase
VSGGVARAAGGIGVFDSGIGGLTVLHALREAVPEAGPFVYLGDTARVPYGTKSDDTVVRYALEGARFLLRRGVRALVVACNTMSAVAIEALQRVVEVPVVGVIEPGVEAAARATRTRRIGVIGTAATVKSGAYARALQARLPGVVVVSRACPLFVPLAEEGWVDNDVARLVARTYLDDFGGDGVDTLVLGCTHYPLLGKVIGEAIGPAVTLVDSAVATAQAVRTRLIATGQLQAAGADPATGDHFFVTDSSERFREVGSRFLGRRLERLELVDLAE